MNINFVFLAFYRIAFIRTLKLFQHSWVNSTVTEFESLTTTDEERRDFLFSFVTNNTAEDVVKQMKIRERKETILLCNHVLPIWRRDQSVMLYDSRQWDWKSTISTRDTRIAYEKCAWGESGPVGADRYRQMYTISRHERNIFQRAVESQKRGTNWDFYYEYPFIWQSNGVFPSRHGVLRAARKSIARFILWSAEREDHDANFTSRHNSTSVTRLFF